MSSASVSRVEAEKRLAFLWTVGGLAVFVLLALQSLLGKYGDQTEGAWSWFLPAVVPTLSLMYGALASEARAPAQGRKRVPRFLLRLAFWLSFLYLSLVVMVPLIQPFSGLDPATLMKRSNLWLGPLQGLVAAVIGVFFVKAERDEAGTGTGGKAAGAKVSGEKPRESGEAGGKRRNTA